MKLSFLNLSIRNKLFWTFYLFFLALIILTFLIVSFFFNMNSRNMLEQELEVSAELALQVVESNAQDTIRSHLKSLTESSLDVLNFIYRDGQEEGQSPLEMQKKASEYLRSLTVGDNGYVYVLDGEGTILVHPFMELEGTSVREFEFVQQQLRDKKGYLEYLWKNPGDPEARRKVLYMETFAPWQWIVSVSAYRAEFHSLVQIDQVKETISQIRVGNEGYLFVMDRTGKFLIHPHYEGAHYNDIPVLQEQDRSFFDEMMENLNGSMEYEWIDPVSLEKQKKMLTYRYIPEFDWIIATSVKENEHRRELFRVNITLILIFLISSCLFFLISRYLSKMLTQPVFNLISFIDSSVGTDYSARFQYDGNDEIRSLSDHFNLFLSMLQKEKDERHRVEQRNRVLAQFPEGNPYPVMRVDRNLKVLYANPASFELLESWGGMNAFLPEEFRENLISQGEPFGSFDYYTAVNSYNIIFSYFREQDAFYLFFQDISERKENEYQMLMSESVFNNTLEGIAITDPAGHIKRVNPAFCRITGYSMDEVLGQNPRILKSDRHAPEFYKNMWDSIIHEGAWSGEIWNRRKNGEAYPEWLTINSIFDEKGHLLHYVSLFRDISDIKESEERLRHQAYHDALTGLPNRLLFMDRLEQAIRQAERGKESLAVMFLDMDNFKTINDSKGHSVGDFFLERIAERLRHSCRQEDTVARLGGDEFTILLPSMQDNRSIVEIVQRVQEVTRQPMTVQDMEIIPSVSIGVTFYPQDGDTMELLMKNADMAMYKAKQSGKGGYSFYNSRMDEQFQKRLDMENRLRRALENDEISLVYQPKVSSVTGSVLGAEALVRWKNPDLGVIPPSEFIPLAEESGFILELGDWVLEHALMDMKDFQQSGLMDFEMAVNLSARQFRDSSLTDRIESILGRTGVSRQQVNLEITENIAMEHSDESIAILERLYDLGLKISIDDFGTGYSSYSYLKKFRTHTLKIDKTFVDELPGETKTSAIMKNMIDLGHTLNMEVVAEGVEEESQFLHLKELGCDIIQGYYFSKPLTREDFLLYLES